MTVDCMDSRLHGLKVETASKAKSFVVATQLTQKRHQPDCLVSGGRERCKVRLLSTAVICYWSSEWFSKPAWSAKLKR